MPIPAETTIRPGSPYGESKFMMERALHWTRVTGGLRYACLRYFNAAGCTENRGEDHDPETHIIPLVLQVALGQRDRIKIFGSMCMAWPRPIAWRWRRWRKRPC